jgi:hypothetical protein
MSKEYRVVEFRDTFIIEGIKVSGSGIVIDVCWVPLDFFGNESKTSLCTQTYPSLKIARAAIFYFKEGPRYHAEI